MHSRYLNDETEGRTMMAMKLHLQIQQARQAHTHSKQRRESPRSALSPFTPPFPVPSGPPSLPSSNSFVQLHKQKASCLNCNYQAVRVHAIIHHCHFTHDWPLSPSLHIEWFQYAHLVLHASAAIVCIAHKLIANRSLTITTKHSIYLYSRR